MSDFEVTFPTFSKRKAKLFGLSNIVEMFRPLTQLSQHTKLCEQLKGLDPSLKLSVPDGRKIFFILFVFYNRSTISKKVDKGFQYMYCIYFIKLLEPTNNIIINSNKYLI